MTDALTPPARPSAPWDRLPEESPEEYAAFWAWLHARPRPAAEGAPNLTPTWRERAGAWDLQCDVYAATGGVAGAKALCQALLAGSLQIAVQEMIKDYHASLRGERRMSPRDRVALLALLKSDASSGGALAALTAPAEDGGADLDWGACTEEERAVLMKALPIFERRKKR